MRPFLVLAFALACLAAPAAAQPGPITGFGFLRLEPSARAAALGGSFSAVYGGDVNGLFYNPALLNPQADGALALSYLNHVGDLNAGFVAYGHDVPGIATFGAGLRYLGWGEFERADEEGNRLGTFAASDVALTVGAARAYSEHAQIGATVHAILSTIDTERASALAADLGFLYRLPNQALTFSATVNNVGATFASFGERTDELPFDVRLGVAKRLRYVPLLLSVTGYNLHDIGGAPVEEAERSDAQVAIQHVLQHLALGGEFQFSDSFNVRFGYNHRRHEALKTKARLDLAGVSLGFGIKTSRIGVDYAYNTWSAAGGLHQFTLSTAF